MTRSEKKKASDRRYYERHKEAILARSKEYRRARPIQDAEDGAKYRRKHRGRRVLTVARSLGRPIAATEAEVEAAISRTAVCEICGQPPKTRRLAVDHCHITGRLRGILCARCNTRAGHLDALHRDPSLARKWAAYLQRALP